MGGRGSGSNMTSSSTSNNSVRQSVEPARVTGGSVSGDFIKTSDGRYVSEKQAVTAAAITYDQSGPEMVGRAVGLRDPRFEIVRGEYKGQTVYRVYENGLNRRSFLFRSRSVQDAAKRVNR